jgi:DNA mismatch repair ATPase MutS
LRIVFKLLLDEELVSLRNFKKYDVLNQTKSLILDGRTLLHLEILGKFSCESFDLQNDNRKLLLTQILIRIENDRDMGIEGTLLETLDHCHTPFGIILSNLHTVIHYETQPTKQTKRPKVLTLNDVLNVLLLNM